MDLGPGPAEPVRCRVKIRYRQPEQDAVVTPLAGGWAKLVFDTPQRAITPGQAAVFYDGDLVLGGGVLTAREETA
ncbi:MAG: aminomethyltransferase beta-barrel domain-containing protein [Oscillospiraceae bacterium]